MEYAVFDYEVDRFGLVATLKELFSYNRTGFANVMVGYGLAV